MDAAKVGKMKESINKCNSNPSIIHTILSPSSSPIFKGMINFAIIIHTPSLAFFKSYLQRKEGRKDGFLGENKGEKENSSCSVRREKKKVRG
ncbi:hypothetical protein C1H46_021771 [Malus baccata]|uniref:Uncharacterized protein n=1 Tax=Malus baccata TaxID=106549 RepID=A0A540M1M9_MALBA|nr:hypothetical protein C1H46_021771 [Malus baccata]